MALKDLYTHLTPIQRVNIARHPNRPTCLHHIFNITEKFVELHGDRGGYDDPAIITGLGSINGRSYMFIGQQKGRNTKENIMRNFGMPTPHGYVYMEVVYTIMGCPAGPDFIAGLKAVVCTIAFQDA
ncbi:acetyl-coenzyme A carboxylase carboxyl transferase subunit alpha, chloroplastic-like isoform X2 [Apium graveolens]|uniref:acetyl-coenzyme A carboxylase carboxyl transferase subunit alpha, chloroplastic-like isoform X2 n=1 Tax=Apium graveolens TaxID=4045 RepID=UPI003D7A89B8